MELLQDTNIWFLFSFVIFFAIAWKLGKNAILNMLDRRIESIKEEIQTAETLRVEAQEMLAQYQRKHRDALQESEEIIENAKKHANQMKAQAEAELKETMERREKQLQERLTRMEQSAVADIQKYAAELAIQATTEIIADKLDKKSNETLVDQAIKDIGKNIH